MNKIKVTAIAALGMISLAFSSHGQTTITMDDSDLLMGFRTLNAPGNNLNLELNLGSFTQFTQMNGSTFTLPELNVLDLSQTYGASWNTRSDLFWSIGTGNFNGGIPGLALNTILESSVNNGGGSQVFQRNPNNLQRTVAQQMDFATGGLNGATSTTNSNFAALIPDANPNSYDQAITGSGGFPNPWNANNAFQMSFANVENTTAIPTGGFVSSDLYELVPTTTGHAASVFLGTFELFGNGTLEFVSAIPEPSTYRMLALGATLLCGLMILRRRRSARI